MKKKIAFLFPGQGAQYPGMGKDFFEAFSIARETFEEAEEILQEKFTKVIFEGPEEVLTQTRRAQVAIFVTSVALLRTMGQQLGGITPVLCSGLSLGEYTALHASYRLPFADTLRLVNERGALMNEACEKIPGTMAAVLGLEASTIESTVKELKGVWVANYNAPGQTVLSGTKEGIEKAALVLKEKGAKRVLPLTVHGAFHSGLMQIAQDGLTPSIQRAPIQESPIAFVMNVPGDFVSGVDTIRRHLMNQVTHSVRWEQGICAMKESDIDLYLEIGCGKTLNGLNKKIGVSAPTLSLEKIVDLEDLARHLEQHPRV